MKSYEITCNKCARLHYIKRISATLLERNERRLREIPLMTRPLHWNDIITHEHNAADGTGEFADRNESVWTEGWCASVPSARASVSFVMQREEPLLWIMYARNEWLIRPAFNCRTCPEPTGVWFIHLISRGDKLRMQLASLFAARSDLGTFILKLRRSAARLSIKTKLTLLPFRPI